jgi:hypothetical protein
MELTWANMVLACVSRRFILHIFIYCVLKITNSIKQSPSWEHDSRLASQEIYSISYSGRLIVLSKPTVEPCGSVIRICASCSIIFHYEGYFTPPPIPKTILVALLLLHIDYIHSCLPYLEVVCSAHNLRTWHAKRGPLNMWLMYWNTVE